MSKKTKNAVIAAVALVLVIAVAVGAYFLTRPETEIGEKSITFTIVDNEKVEKDFLIKTNEEYLAKALEAEGLITYDTAGLYTTINGVTADYNADGAWWAIYIGDEMASVGLNEIPVTDGGEYGAVYTIGFAS